MGFSDFWLQSNNGKKISPENFRELKKSDLNNNSALIRIFNIFDTQNADGTKGADGILNKEELASLFNAMSNAAKSKGNASIFEDDEAEEYINTTQTSEGKSLKELGIKVSDLFKFLGALMPQETVIPADVAMPEIPDRSYTPDEIENISIQTLTDDVKKARQIFNSQNENQGAVSDFVNQTKETFNTEYAASRVNRYIMREELCAELLTKSKSKEGLSEKEYLEAKIDLAVRMLPQLKSTSLRNQIIQNISLFGAAYRAFSKKSRAEQERIIQEIEIELLKDALRKLTPEGLTELIDNIASASDEDYKREAAKYAEQMVKNSLDEKILNKNNQKAPLESRGIINYKYEPVPGSIEQIEKRSSIYRKMTFEETFETERCVPYNSDYIMDYAEKDAQMQFVLSMNNKRQQIYNILHNPTVAVDSKNQFGDVGSGTKLLEQKLEGAIITALRNLYGDDIEKMQEGLNKLGIPGIKIVTSGGLNGINLLKLVFVGEDIDNPTLLTNKTELNSYDLVNVANKLQSMVDANYENALAGKTIDEYSQETKSAYMMAYGAKNAQDMAEAFAQSQQEGVQTVKTVTQTGAMLVMVAGQFVPVGGQVAAGMIYSGLAASAVGGAGISALENYTKAGGPTEEDKKEMLQELATGVALVSSGMWIGRTSEAAFRALVVRNCPKLLAWASEIGIDATMGLVADWAITGQIDFSGEGIAQLQAILVGILHAKGNFRTYIDTHAGDITTKSQNNPTEETTGKSENERMPRKEEDIQILPIESRIKISREVAVAADKVLDINDPMYEDMPRISEYLYNKIEAQMEVINPEEISVWADNISKKHGISKQEVLNIMSRLTQFGNYQSLIKLGNKLTDLNIGSFYKDSGISANLVFNYLFDSKQQFEMFGKNQAFILDKAGLEYIENLSIEERDMFKQKVESGNIILINLDGTCLKIGDNYYSYTMLDGSQSLEAMTEAVINQMHGGKELNDVLNSSYKNKIQELLGKEIASKIENVSVALTECADANSIASQLKPNMPNAKIIQATIEEYAESLHIFGEDVPTFKALLAKYIDYTIKVNSNDSYMRALKATHTKIQQKVAELGKNMDDVIYVYPRSEKSYVIVQYMYAKANNIAFDKFIKYDGTTALPPGKVIVILDDVVSSGKSMVDPYADPEGCLGFSYKNAHINNPNSNIIFAPLLCADEGFEFIKNKIKEFGNNDILLETSRTNVVNFQSRLSIDEYDFLLKHLGYLGYDRNMLCVAFPYMIPDNCCEFSGLLLDFCLNYTVEDEANKAAGFVYKYKPRILERAKR